jgi:hypothetical protein
MCAGVTTWLLLDVITGVYVSLKEYTLVGSPELLVVVLSLMSLMATVSLGEHFTDGHEDRAYSHGEHGVDVATTMDCSKFNDGSGTAQVTVG